MERRRDLRLILHAAVFAALAAWSWRKWPDPLIDFGRELYTPWQLAGGHVLYRDVASLFGPFSQYVNALWFTVFGVSLTTLVACNLAILAAITYGVHRLVADACDRATATAASLAVLLLFGFSQYLPIGNYNFVTPYSHEATHSLALAIGVLLAVARGLRTRGVSMFALAGVLTGCILLTRIETSLAIVVALVVGLGGAAALGADDRHVAVRGALTLAGCALVPAAAFVAYFSTQMPLATAARAVAGSWPALVGGGIAASRFYAHGSGMDAPVANAIRMVTMFGGFAAVVGAAWLADRLWPPRLSTWQNVVWRIFRLVLLGASFIWVPWADLPRAFPLIAGTAFAVLLFRFWRIRGERPAARRFLCLLMWAAFALALLAKMILNTRIYHYGFYLALPATVLLIVVVLWLIPRTLAGRGAGGEVFRTIAGLMMLAGLGFHLALSYGIYRLKQEPIGSGADAFYAFGAASQWQGPAVRDALAWIARTTGRDQTIAVLPEGVMINYLSRRANPTPYLNVMPPELQAFGESRILSSLQAHPPDYVLLVAKDETEYGVGAFGVDAANGARIVAWIDTNYDRADLIGRPPRAGGDGIEILKRRSSATLPKAR